MNHAITIGDVLAFGLVLSGVAILGFGGLVWMAAGQAPVPESRLGVSGCLVALLGVAMIVCGVWAL